MCMQSSVWYGGRWTGQIQDCAACVSIQDKVKSVAKPQCVANEVYMCSFKWALSKHLLISAVDNCPSGLQVDHVRHCYAIHLMAMFCKVVLRTTSRNHLNLLPASLQRVVKRPVTDLTGQTQAVLPPSTVRQSLKANKLSYSESHAALTLSCPLCERETSQTVFINKTTGGLVCPPCKVHGELIRLWLIIDRSTKWSCSCSVLELHHNSYNSTYVCM